MRFNMCAYADDYVQKTFRSHWITNIGKYKFILFSKPGKYLVGQV